MPKQLSYREAARHTHRSVRAIKRWRQHGMAMGWSTRNGQLVRVVELSVLNAWWRTRMRNDPVWQNKLRAQLAAETAAQDATRRVSPGSTAPPVVTP